MVDEVLWQKDSQGLKFLLYDGLGSVIAATDAGGITVSTLSYDVFGKVFSQSGESLRYGYTGRPMDGTGLQYNRARYYDKAIGRWNRQDDYRGEMSVPASLHRYQYVFNNPVNYSDPSGYQKSGWQIAYEMLAALILVFTLWSANMTIALSLGGVSLGFGFAVLVGLLAVEIYGFVSSAIEFSKKSSNAAT